MTGIIRKATIAIGFICMFIPSKVKNKSGKYAKKVKQIKNPNIIVIQVAIIAFVNGPNTILWGGVGYLWVEEVRVLA